MEKTYKKIDDFNIAVFETTETKTILNIETLGDERNKLVEEYNKALALIDEALARFEE